MLRSVFALVVCVQVVTAADPAPKNEPQIYFPTKAGTKWTREATTPDGTRSVQTAEVTKVERKDGAFRVTVAYTATAVAESVFVVSEKGNALVQQDGRADFPAPQHRLKLPAKAGDTWKTELQVHDADGAAGRAGRAVKITCTVGAAEEVKVPAGTFNATPVTGVRDGDGAEETNWYGPGVGVVKTVDKRAGRVALTTVLKSFTPGK